MGFPGGSDGKESAHSEGDPGSVPGLGRSPGTHSSNLAWRILCTEEPGRLHGVTKSRTQLMGNSLLFLGCLMLGKDTDKGEASGKPKLDNMCFLEVEAKSDLFIWDE